MMLAYIIEISERRDVINWEEHWEENTNVNS